MVTAVIHLTVQYKMFDGARLAITWNIIINFEFLCKYFTFKFQLNMSEVDLLKEGNLKYDMVLKDTNRNKKIENCMFSISISQKLETFFC